MQSLAHTPSQQSGFSMVEVLVSLIILLIGLLGLAGLMVQSQRSEMESYQRVQALILLKDMYGRINTNRNVARCYAFTTNTANGTPYLGTTGAGVFTGWTPTSCTLAPPVLPAAATAAQLTQFSADLTAWNALLQGAAETSGGNNAGAMIGARGCVSYDAATELPQLDPITALPTGAFITGTGIYTVSVVWQGIGDTFAPALTCGQGLYGAETRRRVVSLPFRVAAMQ